jgi:hypothetical protein
MKYLDSIRGQWGIFFPNNIFLSNYHFTHGETAEETDDNTTARLLGHIVYRKRPHFKGG